MRIFGASVGCGGSCGHSGNAFAVPSVAAGVVLGMRGLEVVEVGWSPYVVQGFRFPRAVRLPAPFAIVACGWGCGVGDCCAGVLELIGKDLKPRARFVAEDLGNTGRCWSVFRTWNWLGCLGWDEWEVDLRGRVLQLGGDAVDNKNDSGDGPL